MLDNNLIIQFQSFTNNNIKMTNKNMKDFEKKRFINIFSEKKN